MLRHRTLIMPRASVASIRRSHSTHVRAGLFTLPLSKRQLRFRRRGRRRVRNAPAHRIGDELIFIDHEEARGR